MTSPLSRLSAFVHIWLDEFSEDFRDPPLHPALQLLLDHLRISSAVHDNQNIHPTFSSLVERAECLLRSFRTGDARGPAAVSTADARSCLSSGPTEDEESADEDSGQEQSLNEGDIMDFSAVAVAEQLTRMDSVCERRFFILFTLSPCRSVLHFFFFLFCFFFTFTFFVFFSTVPCQLYD